jgi:lysophospholipase L1-like esterase
MAPPADAPSTEALIAALKQLAQQAHQRGLKVFGATLTPFEGADFPGYFQGAKEAKRKALNQWIRSGGAFDGVIDFDKAVRDSSHPTRLKPGFDSGDHLHPNDTGYEAMARSIDLAFFR